MAKYYVQSGSFRGIVNSIDADRAALWAIHTVMQRVVPLDSDQPVQTFESDEHLALGETIQLSERGFDDDQSSVVDTFEAFRHWYELLQTMDKLQSVLFNVETELQEACV